MINRLVESDHKRFAIITGPKDSMVGLERCESARQRIEDLGYQVNFSFAGDYSYECGRDAVLALKEHSSELVDAVICANDMMAIGVIDALRYQLQVQVPEQVSVVGFDGIGPATWSSFDLTTIRQPVSRMAQAAVAMLMERIDDPQIPPEKRLFSGVLITGNSARIAT